MRLAPLACLAFFRLFCPHTTVFNAPRAIASLSSPVKVSSCKLAPPCAYFSPLAPSTALSFPRPLFIVPFPLMPSRYYASAKTCAIFNVMIYNLTSRHALIYYFMLALCLHVVLVTLPFSHGLVTLSRYFGHFAVFF